MEFPISRRARALYRIDDSLLSPRGTAVFSTVLATRALADTLNRGRDVTRHPERAIKAGQLNALGLIEEILRHVLDLYRESKNPHVSQRAVEWLYERAGREAVDGTHRAFMQEFPPLPVARGETQPAAYLDGGPADRPHRATVQDEILMVWLANVNPAYAQFLDLFDDMSLRSRTRYAELVASVHEFFRSQPPFGPDGQNLVDMLRSPAVASPHSLYGQLEYIWSRWGYLLGRYEHVYSLLRGLDLIREEESLRPQGPGLSRPYDFAWLGGETEQFSPDRVWMPRLVLLAKNVYVWMDQLSKRYGREIATLDRIPDAELELLARRGMSGLWLIGLWERSPASRRIKQLRGNEDAVASAYSLFEYRIAGDLGGETAFQKLKDRAWSRGIRLASDMVPNHMGIDSPWVIDHPDWFLSLPASPFPVYTFGGHELSGNERVGIRIEDHYFDHTDAAVVFKRTDRWTGVERYIYHGNDGTSMPWNDTAQINYLNPEAREAVIQTILDVARRFPVLRFDAAMTLAKRHFQRLWFPEPGMGGAVPSRAEHGLTKDQFDAAMPDEFWREVVDRVAAEVPDTLLLAEAFWMMEGYFVRTLGMHRVYNSAFMNMLRDEDNANYRSVIKNTLEFDPEILKRYVNFMNNPDEKTAVEQFGKGDKYFGICTLMATLPGLPMFGHGQVEGFAEKYGMEFRRAQSDEQTDIGLVERHEREIFPLLHRRHLFAEVRNFLLYDVFTENGAVDEDVFCYSNRDESDRVLVVYLNRFRASRGWVRTSVAYAEKSGVDRTMVRKTLGEGLTLRAEADAWVLFRDAVSGLEYIRSCSELHEKGLYLELAAYERRVFTDLREVSDDERGRYGTLAAYLGGRGVPSIEDAWREMFLQPVHTRFKALVNADLLRRLLDAKRVGGKAAKTGAGAKGPGAGAARPDTEPSDESALLDEIESKAARLAEELKRYSGGTGDVAGIVREIRGKVRAVLRLPPIAGSFEGFRRAPRGASAGAKRPRAGAPREGPATADRLEANSQAWAEIFAWVFLHPLGKAGGGPDPGGWSRRWLDELLLGRIVEDAFRDLGAGEQAAARSLRTVSVLAAHQRWLEDAEPSPGAVRSWVRSLLGDEEARHLIGVNRHEDVLWYNKEAFEGLLGSVLIAAVVNVAGAEDATGDRVQAALAVWTRVAAGLRKASEDCDYQLERLLERVESAAGAEVFARGRTAASAPSTEPRGGAGATGGERRRRARAAPAATRKGTSKSSGPEPGTADPAPKAEPASKTDPALKPESAPNAESVSKSEPASKSELEPKAEPAPKAEPEPRAEPASTQPSKGRTPGPKRS